MENIKHFIYSLNIQYVNIAVTVVMVITAVLFSVLVYKILKSEEIMEMYSNTVNKGRTEIINVMKVTKLKAFSFDEIYLYIHRSGLSYIFNDKLTPLGYIILRFTSAMFFLIVGLQSDIITGIILCIAGYFALDVIVNISNKQDNEKMLDDIKNVYDTLRIQTKAGVYITSVITDCYLVVQNKRLKKAFLRLTSDIAAKSDMDESLDNFRNKFDNEYINTLVIIVKQSMKTGQASKMFEDIREQITDIELAQMEAEKKHIQTLTTTCQIALYVAIILVSIYLALTSLLTGLAF